MLYYSGGPLKLKVRDGMLLFCDLVILLMGSSLLKTLGVMKFKSLIEKTTEADFLGKSYQSVQKIFKLVSESNDGFGQNIELIVNKGRFWDNPQKIRSVHLFWAVDKENGIVLNIHSNRQMSISFKIPKKSTAEVLARTANLPEPCAIDWPVLGQEDSNEKTVSGAHVLEFLDGANIPIRDLATFVQGYLLKKQ